MKKILFASIVLLLVACGQDSQEPDATQSSPKQKTQLEKAMSTQLDALEKSKQVEDDMQKAVEKRNKEMENRGI